MNNNEYTPDCWAIVRITSVESDYYRILAGWYGSFMTGDSWKMSSGIIKIIESDDLYEIHNHSGSIYYCYKHAEKFSGYTSSIYAGYAAQSNDEIKFGHVDFKDIDYSLINEST